MEQLLFIESKLLHYSFSPVLGLLVFFFEIVIVVEVDAIDHYNNLALMS